MVNKIKSHILNISYQDYNVYFIITQLKTHNLIKTINSFFSVELNAQKNSEDNIIYKYDSEELSVFLFKNNEKFFKKHKCDFFLIVRTQDKNLINEIESLKNKNGILGFYRLEKNIRGIKELIKYAYLTV